MDRPRPRPSAPQSLLELAQTARIDSDDEVEIGRLDLIELVLEHPAAVTRPEQRVGPRGAAAFAG